MLSESNLRDPILINTIGHTAGLLLFGFIIALLLRDRRAYAIGETRLSILAAALAFSWNAGSLIALGASNLGSPFMQVVTAVSFAVLSLLPAVLLQVILRGQLRAVTRAGYAISAAAIALHVCELFVSSPAPHQIALLLIGAGFAVLTFITGLMKRRSLPETQVAPAEWFSLACLLLFASSFPHFGYEHSRSPWAAEITWHHIGIPVALVVILQDYRFLLLDTFLRFLMNSCLAAAYLAGLFVINRRFHLADLIASNSYLLGFALVLICLSLILFAHVRNRLQQWLGAVLFHRQNLDDRIRCITLLGSQAQSEEELILGSAGEVAAHFRADRFEVISESALPATLGLGLASDKVATDFSWAEAQIPLRFSSGQTSLLLTGQRRGRQRYLSEDLEDMRRLGAVILEQVERFRSEELKRLATQAELRALQAQINPHFLFNAFNTLYGTIDRGSADARRLVLNLTDIFRYFLQGDRSVIALSEELRIVKAYLEIEALRLGERLESEIDVSDSALPIVIPILAIQPLVENAVKHGVASKAGNGRVVLRAQVTDGTLHVMVEDFSLGPPGSVAHLAPGSGVGLVNVRRRLNLSYGPQASLDVCHQDRGTLVTLKIPALLHPLGLRPEVQLAG
jgi:hypothetical protein